MAISCLRSRSITSAVGTRSDAGFSEMNNCPRLTELEKPPPPTDEPTPETAGSQATISAACCCSFTMAG